MSNPTKGLTGGSPSLHVHPSPRSPTHGSTSHPRPDPPLSSTHVTSSSFPESGRVSVETSTLLTRLSPAPPSRKGGDVTSRERTSEGDSSPITREVGSRVDALQSEV